jgi:hypothetical protein
MPAKKTATKAARKPKMKAPAIPAKVYERQPGSCNHQTVYGDAWRYMPDRKFQQCHQCGDIRFTPGQEPAPPVSVYHPPIIKGEAVSLWDTGSVKQK